MTNKTKIAIIVNRDVQYIHANYDAISNPGTRSRLEKSKKSAILNRVKNDM